MRIVQIYFQHETILFVYYTYNKITSVKIDVYNLNKKLITTQK